MKKKINKDLFDKIELYYQARHCVLQLSLIEGLLRNMEGLPKDHGIQYYMVKI